MPAPERYHPPAAIPPAEEPEELLPAETDEDVVPILPVEPAGEIDAVFEPPVDTWAEFLTKHKEGDVVTGEVTRKIKGGLLVDIGVSAFLPASQVDIRRPPDISEYVGKTVECVILKIDEQRRNITVSRRKTLEDQRQAQKQKLLAEVEVGQVRRGVVRQVAEFGAFVDVGGIDGLLHITDLAWDRVANIHDVVNVGQELEVYVLEVDRDREKIALSLKHLKPVANKAVAILHESYVGTVEQADDQSVLVVYDLDDDVVEHTYARSQFVPGMELNVGDEVVVQVQIIKNSPSVPRELLAADPIDDVPDDYPRKRVAGPISF